MAFSTWLILRIRCDVLRDIMKLWAILFRKCANVRVLRMLRGRYRLAVICEFVICAGRWLILAIPYAYCMKALVAWCICF